MSAIASGGLRAVQMTKRSLTALKVVPIAEAVTIPFVAQTLDRESGAFKASEQHDKAAVTMLDELHRWTTALTPCARSAKPAVLEKVLENQLAYGTTKRLRLVERIAVRADGVTPFSGEVTFDSLESWAVDALAH